MKTSHERASEAFLRAIAIGAVVSLHFLASLKSNVYTTASFHHWTIFLDQLGRFCIPLFVALSGYGLMMKYQKTTFSWGEFLRRRVFKLLPAYVLWSLIFYLVFTFLPAWRPSGTPESFVTQLIKGRADYHLYFVPMIFQLYLVFPFLKELVKKYPWLMLLGSAVFEIALYLFFMQRSAVFANGHSLVSDQQQYFWGFTWIFYFILGMCLPQIHGWLKQQRLLVIGLLALTGLSLYLAVTIAITNIDQGVDPIVALRFTRLPLLFYGTMSVISLTWLATHLKRAPGMVKLLADKSYLIYLCHTLVLRIIFTFV